MIVNQSQTEYHHLVIISIDDYSTDLTKGYTDLYCLGKNYSIANTPEGYIVNTYNTRVLVTGRLQDYVNSELAKGDSIFVIGHSVERRDKYKRKYRYIQADCIYKEDWLKYYPKREFTSVKDFSDKSNNLDNTKGEE